MTIDEIIKTAEDAAPWILAILAATTVLAHALARAARAFQRYALTTPATWDDVAARRAVRWADRLSAALAWVSAFLPRAGFGRPSTVLEDASRRAELGSTRRTSRRDAVRPPPGPGSAAVLILAIVVTASPALAACGANLEQQRAGHDILNRVTDVADPTYELAVEGCDAARDAIIARTGTTYDQDRQAMDSVHEVCDPMVEGFETLRGTQLTGRAAIDSGVAGAATEGIVQAMRRWAALQELVPQLATLGVE